MVALTVPAAAQPRWLADAASDPVVFLEHKSASSILLFETRDIRIDGDGHARTHVRLARKLLTTKGIADREGYLTEEETEEMAVRNVRGWRIARNGATDELEDRNVVRISPPGMEAVFSHNRIVIAGFPELTFGDIVGYEYDIDNREPYATYQRHVFQVREPVRYSVVSLTIPKGWTVRRFGWEIDSILYEESGPTRTWTARDLPYRAEEPMMPPWSFLERELKVTVSGPPGGRPEPFDLSDWSSVGRRASAFNDAAIEMTPAISALAESVAVGGTTPLEKIRALASWVQSKVRYVGVEIGPGRWEPHKASLVLANCYGDCKDKVAIFRSLLGAAGIPSLAVLVNTESYVDSAVPSLFQFNHVIAAIPDSGIGAGPDLASVSAQGWVFFDPTDPAQPFGMLPPYLRGNRALVLAGDKSRMVRLPHGNPETYRRYQLAEITLAYPDTLRARVRICDVGPIAHYLNYAAATIPLKTRVESIRSLYSSRYSTFTISDYTTSSSGDSSWTEFLLTVPGAFGTPGGKFYLKPNLFPLDDIIHLTAPARSFPVWFGGPRTVEAEVVCDPGKGWAPEKLISTIADSCPGAVSLGFMVSASGRAIRLTSRFTSSGELVDIGGYDAARRFSSSVQDFNNLTVTVKREK